MAAIPLDAGFSVALDGEQLVFGADVSVRETKTRTRGELASVALEPQACVPPELIQYWMYNDVAAAEHRAKLAESRVQYELTLMFARPLGPELPKTLGHIHNALTAGARTFSEVFEVIHGTAHFLFYALDAEKSRAAFCGWVQAKAGDQIVMPPDLYHLTVNAGSGPLLFADVISKRARGLYDGVRATHGAPYLDTVNGEWRRNPLFPPSAPLAACPFLRLDTTLPLYTQFVRDPAAFAWLDEPELFREKFPDLESQLQ